MANGLARRTLRSQAAKLRQKAGVTFGNTESARTKRSWRHDLLADKSSVPALVNVRQIAAFSVTEVGNRKRY